VPFRRNRPQIVVEHLRDVIGELLATRVLLDRVARLIEYLPQALERPRLDAILIRQRLRADAGAQFGQKFMRRGLVGRKAACCIRLVHDPAQRTRFRTVTVRRNIPQRF
jgi:hypothetical protein